MADLTDGMDKHILYELDADARQPFSRIAKKLRTSQQVVDYRVGRMLDEGVIRGFVTLMEFGRMGYAFNALLMRLQNADNRKIEEISRFLARRERVGVIFRHTGKWDLQVGLNTCDVFNLNEEVLEIEDRYSGYIRESIKGSHFGRTYFARDYLVDEKYRVPRRVAPITGGKAEVRGFEEVELALLALLDQDARMPAAKMAEKVGVSPDTALQKIRRLKEDGVIVGTLLWLNPEAVGRSYYRLIVKLRALTKQREAELYSFLANTPCVWGAIKVFGAWDMSLELEVGSAEELNAFVLELRNRFSGVIIDYDVLACYGTDKFTVFPHDLRPAWLKRA
ncbi:MAG: Lrp/AsnC family transcriptional regulator [Candidatus Micrarchaeota archaeon]